MYNTLQEVEKLLFIMNQAEKAQILQWIVRDFGGAFPGIESNPDISGGEPCIVRTRIPVCRCWSMPDGWEQARLTF